MTKPERETVVTMNDEDKTAEVWTAQRPRITQLKARGAELVEEGQCDGSPYAVFRLPARCVSFRAP